MSLGFRINSRPDCRTSNEARRARSRGSIRGKGYGGGDHLGDNAGVSSDDGFMPAPEWPGPYKNHRWGERDRGEVVLGSLSHYRTAPMRLGVGPLNSFPRVLSRFPASPQGRAQRDRRGCACCTGHR